MPTSLLIRLITIPLGILSALALARDGFGFKLLPFIDAIITAYGLLLDDLFLDIVLAIFEPIFDLLKNLFGWNWILYPHWKHAFVLLWLFFAAELREQYPLEWLKGRTPDPLLRWYKVQTAFMWVWGALAALIGGVAAGTVALDHPAVVWWPLAAYFLNEGAIPLYWFLQGRGGKQGALQAIVLAVIVVSSTGFALGWFQPVAVAGHPSPVWWALVGFFAYQTSRSVPHFVNDQLLGAERFVLLLTFGAIAGAFAVGVLPSPTWIDFQNSPSPGLASLTAYVAAVSTWYLLETYLQRTRRRGLDMFAETLPRIAVDVLAVLCGAAIIVYLSHLIA